MKGLNSQTVVSKRIMINPNNKNRNPRFFKPKQLLSNMIMIGE
jgi:hypothetical protein